MFTDNFDVYKDIQARTGGKIYIDVVGPVRIGKSTFIGRFMELLALPAMEDENPRNLNRNELPQSVTDKTIITTKPKFIPKKAARINLADGVETRVRVADCVGFMVDGAAGHVGNGEEHLAKTPWFDHDIPFTQAAEIGARKVINDHSTVGIVVAIDETIGGIERPGYIAAEKQTIGELKKLRRPFVVLLNSTRPYSDETARLAKEMSESYGVSVLPVSYEQLKKEDIFHTLERVLEKFPVTEMGFHVPRWLEVPPSTHWLKAQVIQAARNVTQKVTHMRNVPGELKQQHTNTVRSMNMRNMQMTDNGVGIQVDMGDDYCYQILNDYVGLPIEDEYQLMQTLSGLANIQKECEKVQNVLTQVRLEGYGVVTPGRSKIVLGEPQVIKHGDKYGVKMKAGAPSINLIKAHIKTEIAPIVGNKRQTQDLITYIRENARGSDGGTWNTNIFGKSIEQTVEDGIQAKVSQMTEDYQLKLQDTLQRIINDSSGDMVCIII